MESTRREKSIRKEIINDWTDELDVLIEDLGNDSSIFKWLHMNNAGYIKARLDHSSMISAIISLAVGTGGLFSTVIQISETSPILSMVVTGLMSILAFIAGGLTLMQRVYDYPGAIEKHKNAEQKFHWLYFDTQAQLRRPKEDRENGNTYYRWATNVYYDASKIEDIDDKILKKYYKEFPKGTVPGIDGIRKIVVIDDESSLEDISEQIKLGKSISDSNTSPKATDSESRDSPKNRSGMRESPFSMVYSPDGARSEITDKPKSEPTKKNIETFRVNLQNSPLYYRAQNPVSFERSFVKNSKPRDIVDYEERRQNNLVGGSPRRGSLANASRRGSLNDASRRTSHGSPRHDHVIDIKTV